MSRRPASPAAGVRRHGAGWQASVFVAGVRHYATFPIDEPLETILAWRKTERARLQLAHVKRGRRPAAGTFASEAKAYLAAVRAMPSYKGRARDIGLWAALFKERRRDTITRLDIQAQRDRWALHGPKCILKKAEKDAHGRVIRAAQWTEVDAPLAASTVNHRLRALSHMWTVLDGRHAPNPAREVPELEEPEGEALGLPYELVETILAAMPDRRYGRKLTDADVVDIRSRLAQGPEVVKSAIARAAGISETMVRKIARGDLRARRDAPSKAKARMAMIAYIGIAPSEMMRLKPHTVSTTAAWIDTGRRRKGKGWSTGRRPLTEPGVKALERFIAADAFGPFSRDALADSFHRACRHVAAAFERAGELAAAHQVRQLRPYDFRHSYVSEVLEKSGDFHATQLLAGHADLRTTLRYGKRGIRPALVAALEKVKAMGGFSGAKVESVGQPIVAGTIDTIKSA